MKIIYVGVLAAVHFTGLAFGQEKELKKIDGSAISTSEINSIIPQLMKRAKIAGLDLALLNDDKIAFIKSYGYKNIEKGELIDTSTVFYAASLSKAVFACLSLMLVQEGILDLDKPLWQYLDKPLPDYDKYADLKGDDRWKAITARMCLSHTTGMPNWRFLVANTGKFDPHGKLAIYFTPGTRYAYSGEGIALLQMVIEKITGNNLEELAKEKIFKPFGMNRTSYIWQEEFEDNYALGYDENEKPLFKKKWTEPGAAGSMETTISDYAKFIQHIMANKELHDEMKEIMLSPQISINSKYQFPTITNEVTTEFQPIQLSYGLGWGLINCKYGWAFFKEGHDDGWEHYNINFMDRGISIIIMTNSSNGESIFKEVLEKTIGDTFTPWQWERYIPYN